MKEKILKYKTKIIIGMFVMAALAGAFFWGGNYPKYEAGDTYVSSEQVPQQISSESAVACSAPAFSSSGLTSSAVTVSPEAVGSSKGVIAGSKDYSESQGMSIDPKTGKDPYQTDPVPEGKPVPVEPQDALVTDRQLKCTLSICCDTILDNMDLLEVEKRELIPENGIIFPASAVTFYKGESVFNVLLREMKKAGIHMEYENTPLYNSAYIEGINNLYEFDVGELSGWMYQVNGWFPNYGCSRYQIKEGDVIEWVYTCDLGKDVGGYYSTGGS